jgi:hypothetical protein
MGAKRIAITDAKVGSPTLKFDAGIYRRAYIYLDGTNASAATMTLADLGKVYMFYKGKPVIAGVDTLMLMHFANIHGNLVKWSSTVSSYIQAIIPIYFSDPENPGNCLYVPNDGDAVIQIIWGSSFIGNLSSGTVRLVAEEAQGNMAYLHKMQQNDFTGQNILESISGENFMRVLLRNGTSSGDFTDIGTRHNDTRMISIEVNQKQIHNASCLESNSIFRHNFNLEDTTSLISGEVTSDRVLEVPVLTNGQMGEMLSDDLKVGLTAEASVTLNVVTTQAEFTSDALSASKAITASKVSEATSRKFRSNRPVPSVAPTNKVESFNQ